MTPTLEETVYLDFVTHRFDTGAVTDADSTPSVEVYEDATDTPILTPTPAKRTSKTGNYRVAVACTAANGFEAGKSYNVIAIATVNSVQGKGRIGSFQVRANDADDLATDIGTVDGIVDAIKLVTDNLPDSGALTSLATAAALGTVDTVVDAIKVVTDNLPNSGALSDLATLASRLTALRAGYLDNLNGHTPQTGDSFAVVNSGTHGNAALKTLIDTLDAVADAIKAVTDNLPDSGALTSLAQASKLIAYVQLLARSDAAIATDNATELGEINADGGSGAGDFDNAAEALEAIRDRGDASWITGGGGGITQSLNVQFVHPTSIDLADTATVRLGIILVNALDDLPSTAEITPGTISLERKAIGGTSWSAVVTDAAMSEQAGMVYYDEVFDAGSGYAEGDSIRITFKSVSITADSNTHEVVGAAGVFFQTEIRQTMRGTDSANTTTPLDAASVRSAVGLASANLDTQLGALPTAAENRAEMDSNSTQLAALVSAIAALNDPTAAAIAAAVLAAGDVDGFSIEEAMKLILSACAAKLSGAATTTVTIRAADDSKDRITATVDADGNRSAVTLDAAG